MTDRKQALSRESATPLTDLLVMIEAGDNAGFRKANRAVFSTPCQDMALQLLEEHSRHAYKGSLDAAKALHEAVLPEWVARPHIGGSGAGIAFWHCDIENWETGEEISVMNQKCSARAWLIAIIKVLIAEEQDNG